MAQIKLSTEKFPGEDISFAEKLTQIKKNLDKDVAYKQLIYFAYMISACLEVYGEDNVIWQESVTSSGNGVKTPSSLPAPASPSNLNTVPPPPPPPPPAPAPPPSNLKTVPKLSTVERAQKLLELFEQNTFKAEKIKATLFALSGAIRKDIQLDLQNSKADVKHYKSAEKQLSREISTKENQHFIPIVEVSNSLIELVLKGKIDFVGAQLILDDVKKQIGTFTSKQEFQTDLFQKYNINNIDINTISYKKAQESTIKDFDDYRKQYQDAMSSTNSEIQNIDVEIYVYSSVKKDASHLMSRQNMLKEKLDFLQKNVSIIDRFNWQVVELIAERNADEQQWQFYKNIFPDTESCKVVQSGNKTKPLVAKKFAYDDLLAARVTPSSSIGNKIKLLIKEGGIFKSCLSTTEYLDFIVRAKEYLLEKASLLEPSDLHKLQAGLVIDVEFGQFIEELILKLNTSNRKGAFSLTLIEKKLLNFAENEHLFSVTLKQDDQEIIVTERQVKVKERANYQLDHARLAYERNKYFFENFKNMLHIKDKDFFVTDFFTYEEMEKIISFLRIEKKLLDDYDYDSEKTNNLLLEYINSKFSEEQPHFIDLIKDNKDHRAVYPICQMEDLLERLIMTDKPPYKLTDLSNKQSARQYAEQQHKEKQQEITDVAQVLPVESHVAHLEHKAAKSPPPFIRVNSSKLLFNFNIVAALKKEINQPEISTIVFDANFPKTFDCFYETQQKLINTHKDFYKQLDEEAIEKLLLPGNSIEQMNEMSIYHDLAIFKDHDQSIKILQEDLEDGSKQAIDLINISYKTEISHGNYIINKNIVKVDALKVDDNNELDDKSCIIMLLSIKNLSKNKKFTIEYCEDRPETAMKFFLFGKILGLTPTMNDDTSQAIEQAKITPLKSCYLEVINSSVQLSSTEILELLNKSLANQDKKFLV